MLDTNEDAYNLVKSIASAFEYMPLIQRLEYVKILLCERGGSLDSIPRDLPIATAVEILDTVINIINKDPRAKKLRMLVP